MSAFSVAPDPDTNLIINLIHALISGISGSGKNFELPGISLISDICLRLILGLNPIFGLIANIRFFEQPDSENHRLLQPEIRKTSVL